MPELPVGLAVGGREDRRAVLRDQHGAGEAPGRGAAGHLGANGRHQVGLVQGADVDGQAQAGLDPDRHDAIRVRGFDVDREPCPGRLGVPLLDDGDGARGRGAFDADEIEAAGARVEIEVLIDVRPRGRRHELVEKPLPSGAVAGVEDGEPPRESPGRLSLRRRLRGQRRGGHGGNQAGARAGQAGTGIAGSWLDVRPRAASTGWVRAAGLEARPTGSDLLLQAPVRRRAFSFCRFGGSVHSSRSALSNSERKKLSFMPPSMMSHGSTASSRAVAEHEEVGVDARFGDGGAPVAAVALGRLDGRRDAAIAERQQRLVERMPLRLDVEVDVVDAGHQAAHAA